MRQHRLATTLLCSADLGRRVEGGYCGAGARTLRVAWKAAGPLAHEDHETSWLPRPSATGGLRSPAAAYCQHTPDPPAQGTQPQSSESGVYESVSSVLLPLAVPRWSLILNPGKSCSPLEYDFRAPECSGFSTEGPQKAVVPPPALTPDQGQGADALRLLPLVSPHLDLVQ